MGRVLRPARDPHHGDLVRGRFQPVQRGVAPGGESGTARRTSKGLDALGSPMLAVSDEGMEGSVGVTEVDAVLIGTGVALGLHTSDELPVGFSPQTRGVQEHAVVLHPTRPWRRDDRRDNRLECGAGGVGGACCASPLLVNGKAEDWSQSRPQSSARKRRRQTRSKSKKP
jgi:hypothetical protein